MRSRLITTAALVAASCLWVGSASAQALMAGWDFSQYAVDGALSLDGSTFTDSLSANYSALDATNNAGAESAAFGTFHIDGTNGSTNVDEASASAAVVPTAAVPGSFPIRANLEAPATSFGTNPFNSFSILTGEGQTQAQELAITARSAADVVFRAGQAGNSQSGWTLSFAGRTVTGTSSVDVEFSENCGSYSVVGSVPLTETESETLLVLSGTSTDIGCVRLGLDPSNGQPIIDNVAIFTPEPATTSLLVAGVLGLAAIGRRRQA